MKRLVVISLLVLGAQAANATPLVCASECTITTGSYGYLTPVTEIASGALVRWVTSEASHPTADSSSADGPCFSVGVGALTPVVPVRFTAAGGVLTATTAPGTPEEQSAPCTGAHSLPNGGYALTFGCMLHQWMRGALIVDPA